MARFNYGGQAVMEGVMMRGEHEWAVSVRAPDGTIVQRHDALPAGYRSRWLKLPLLRGLRSLGDSLDLGMRALLWSSDVALGEDEGVHFSGPLAWGTVAVSLAFGVGLFFLLPTFLASLMERVVPSGLASNLIEGLIRLGVFVAYLAVVGLMPDVRRVFAYHGAEHKTVNAYEKGAPLTPEAVMAHSRVHTRCGTGFMLLVMLIFVVVSTLLGPMGLALRLLSRLVLIPVVAGIAYEIIRFSARHYDRSAVVRLIMAPGLALQQLTTREPTPDMVEVAIHALSRVLVSEGLLPEPESVPAGVEVAPIPAVVPTAL
jgi:uncharacterized protein YqhQ